MCDKHKLASLLPRHNSLHLSGVDYTVFALNLIICANILLIRQRKCVFGLSVRRRLMFQPRRGVKLM